MTRIIKLLISTIYFMVCCIIVLPILLLLQKKIFIVIYYHNITAKQKNNFIRQVNILSKFSNPVSAYQSNGFNLKLNNVIITFDDGYQNIFDNAIPELIKRNIPVTVFVPTSLIGKSPDWESIPEYLIKEKLVDLNEINSQPSKLVTFGSHTCHHKKLTQLEMIEIVREMKNSKIFLEDILHKNISLFSFPYGLYTDKLVTLANNYGYTKTFTIEPAVHFNYASQNKVGRISVSPDDSALEFLLKILGAYSWLYLIIIFKNFIKSVNNNHL